MVKLWKRRFEYKGINEFTKVQDLTGFKREGRRKRGRIFSENVGIRPPTFIGLTRTLYVLMYNKCAMCSLNLFYSLL